ncbi:putative protein FAM150B-like [Scophthalmus maximus]|uniref:ALK and LTK ligand 2 n=1 Tax=Scophthalmus maximus TaxID=52904 RepID=A0A2U9CWL2_SCOMX|nr:putative protein FAM150B-like [Scophthalmus maximus]
MNGWSRWIVHLYLLHKLSNQQKVNDRSCFQLRRDQQTPEITCNLDELEQQKKNDTFVSSSWSMDWISAKSICLSLHRRGIIPVTPPQQTSALSVQGGVVFPRELRKKEKFLKHITGPLYFSPKCRKQVYRVYHHTRDCTIPAWSEHCLKMQPLSSLSVSSSLLRLQKVRAAPHTASWQSAVHRGVAHTSPAMKLQLYYVEANNKEWQIAVGNESFM